MSNIQIDINNVVNQYYSSIHDLIRLKKQIEDKYEYECVEYIRSLPDEYWIENLKNNPGGYLYYIIAVEDKIDIIAEEDDSTYYHISVPKRKDYLGSHFDIVIDEIENGWNTSERLNLFVILEANEQRVFIELVKEDFEHRDDYCYVDTLTVESQYAFIAPTLKRLFIENYKDIIKEFITKDSGWTQEDEKELNKLSELEIFKCQKK